MSGRPANARVQASKAEINHNCWIVAASKVWHPYSCYSLDTRGEDTGSPACRDYASTPVYSRRETSALSS